MVDLRWIILAVILLGAAWLIYRRPGWAVAAGVGVAAAALAYTIMFTPLAAETPPTCKVAVAPRE